MDIFDNTLSISDFERTIIEYPDYIYSRDSHGNTALIALACHSSPGKLKLLLDNGADVDAENHDGCTALMISATNCQFRNTKLLLKNNADIAKRDSVGRTALHLASMFDIESTRQLLDAGADIEAKDIMGKAPLIFAVTQNKLECIKLLLNRGADPDTSTLFGKTALMLAAIRNRSEIVAILLAAGASYEKVDDYKQSALDQPSNPECSELLQAAANDIRPTRYEVGLEPVTALDKIEARRRNARNTNPNSERGL